MSLKLNSSGGGSVTLQEPATASTLTLNIPAVTGTVITTADSGTVSSTMIANASITEAKLAQPMTLATAQNTTSGTTIDFTGIPSWVKAIRVMLRQVSTNGSSGLGVQIGTSGGLQTSGYNSFSNDLDNGGGSGGGSSTAHFFIRGSAATNVFSGSMVIYTMGSNVWVSDHTMTYGSNRIVMGAGDVALSGTLDRLRFLTSNGTDAFDAGSVNIMYEG